MNKISAILLEPINHQEIKNIDDFFIINDYPVLNKFKEYSFDKEISYYDIESEANKLNISTKNLAQDDISLVNGELIFTNTKHSLYKASLWLISNWHNNFDSLALFKESNFYGYFFTEYRNKLIEYGWKEKYSFRTQFDIIFNLVDAHNFVQREISITFDLPVSKKIEKCLAYRKIHTCELEIQENSLFYSDNIADRYPIIVDKKMFIKQDHIKSKLFTEKIVDKFIENKNFVIFC